MNGIDTNDPEQDAPYDYRRILYDLIDAIILDDARRLVVTRALDAIGPVPSMDDDYTARVCTVLTITTALLQEGPRQIAEATRDGAALIRASGESAANAVSDAHSAAADAHREESQRHTNELKKLADETVQVAKGIIAKMTTSSKTIAESAESIVASADTIGDAADRLTNIPEQIGTAKAQAVQDVGQAFDDVAITAAERLKSPLLDITRLADEIIESKDQVVIAGESVAVSMKDFTTRVVNKMWAFWAEWTVEWDKWTRMINSQPESLVAIKDDVAVIKNDVAEAKSDAAAAYRSLHWVHFFLWLIVTLVGLGWYDVRANLPSNIELPQSYELYRRDGQLFETMWPNLGPKTQAAIRQWLNDHHEAVESFSTDPKQQDTGRAQQPDKAQQ